MVSDEKETPAQIIFREEMLVVLPGPKEIGKSISPLASVPRKGWPWQQRTLGEIEDSISSRIFKVVMM